jgi:hypothetical protein
MTTSSKSRFNSLAHTLSVATASLLLCTPISAKADIIELHNGDLLTGNIHSLDKTLVTMESPLADTPLKIKAEAIRKISFPDQAKDTPNHTERLTLTNNDTIPCKVITMDDKDLHVFTWYAGKFSIPRNNIQSLQFGLSEEKTLYTGNDDPSRWTTRKGRWNRTDTGYTCSGNSILARKLDLPENVRFNFDLSWKENPNFVFRFCAESDAATTKQDTYEFVFNSAGMQIRRYENSNQPAGPLANIAIKPHSIATRKLNIDLRVNRSEGLLTLSIDNQLIGTWPDPFNTSKGNHIILNNRAHSTSRTSCVISNLHVSGMNDGSLPRYREKTLASKADVLIDSEGEKMSGNIITISNKNTDKRTIVFNVKHSTAPLHVPDHRISTLIFGQPEDTPKRPFSTFTAMLKNNGSLQLARPKLEKGKISCQHPILGPCIIDINALTHIQQSSVKSKTP